MAVDHYPYWMKEPTKAVKDRIMKIADMLAGTIRTVRNITYSLYPDLHGKDLDNAYNVTVKDIVRARIKGYVDWESIKESRCTFKNQAGYDGVNDFWESQELDELWTRYSLDRRPAWKENILIMFEKETVQDEIAEICYKYDVPWVCGRGQATWSIKKTLADFLDSSWTLLYMGDNDEKGVEIFDVIERDLRFLRCGCKFKWAAITDEQADELGIRRDSRLDGPDLDVLKDLVDSIIMGYIDKEKLEEIEEQEREDIRYLRAFKLKVVDRSED